jgi:transaldolase
MADSTPHRRVETSMRQSIHGHSRIRGHGNHGDETAMPAPLQKLSESGQSVWIDFLSRDLLRSGALARAIERDGVVGVTSNPTIFARALAVSDAYDDQLAALWTRERDAKEIFLALAIEDVTRACDLLLPTWRETDRFDGYVSIEVDPRLAGDTKATIEEAIRLHSAVARPNVLVKIPATAEGLAAIEEMTARGSSINVTLIFSLDRYTEVVEAYFRGLERLIAQGGDASIVTSVASFFVSRVDTETDKRLDSLSAPEELRGRLAIANAKLAYQHYKDAFSGRRWEELAKAGARKQRPLWASTSAKDPRYRDTRYVEELIGPETISTMPEETIRAFQDHGRVSSTLECNVDEARAVFAELGRVGVDYHDVVATLEAEGVAKFVQSFDKLLRLVAAKGPNTRATRGASGV